MLKRFLLWLLPARRVVIKPEHEYHGAFLDGRQGPQNIGGWSDLP